MWRSDPRLTLPSHQRLCEPHVLDLLAAISCPLRVKFDYPNYIPSQAGLVTAFRLDTSTLIDLYSNDALIGGTCHAKLRLEGVIRHPEISVDGQVLTRGGRILLDDEPG